MTFLGPPQRRAADMKNKQTKPRKKRKSDEREETEECRGDIGNLHVLMCDFPGIPAKDSSRY